MISRGALLALVLAALPIPALAKAWRGVEPGVSDKNAVLRKFGEPSSRKEKAGKVVLRYSGEFAIEEHTALFIVDDRGVVREIHVFPPKANGIDKDTVLNSYGKGYTEKLTDDLQVYWWYARLGLVVFFDAKGKVDSFIFSEPEPGTTPVKTGGEKGKRPSDDGR